MAADFAIFKHISLLSYSQWRSWARASERFLNDIHIAVNDIHTVVNDIHIAY